MPGARIQLIANSEHELFLTSNPEVTFFKSVYLRHPNFAIETIKHEFSGCAHFGSSCYVTIPNSGNIDYISGMALSIHLGSLNNNNNDNNNTNNNSRNTDLNCFCNDYFNSLDQEENTIFSWVNGIGHAIIEEISIDIGSKFVETHYGEWFDIWTELTQNLDKRLGYNELVGKKDPAGYNIKSFTKSMDLIIPLNFWFCKNIGLSLPLSEIKPSNYIKINFKIRSFNKLWICNNKGVTPNVPEMSVSLLVDYIFLPGPDHVKLKFREKKVYRDKKGKKLEKAPRKFFLIDTLQKWKQSFSKNISGIANVDMQFNYLIKEIIWVIQRTDVLTRSNDDDEDFSYGNDIFNFSNSRNFSSSADMFISASLSLGNNLNTKRLEDMPAKYFRLLQPYKYHTKCPNNFIYVYSFAFSPEGHQPTGFCNNSSQKKMRLSLNMKKNLSSDFTVTVYAVAYQMLVLDKGDGSYYPMWAT